MIHPLNRWKLAWDWAIILFVRPRHALLVSHQPNASPRGAQVLYSAAMVPWSIAFTLHESCAPSGAVHDGCIPEAIKARDRAPLRAGAPS